jgi:thiamine biosynthesis lipoprotein
MRWRTAVCSILLLGYGSGFTPALARFEFSESHMGTRFRIVVYATTAEAARLATSAAFERVSRLDAIMSDYRETSELMWLCRQDAGKKVRVSKDLFRVLVMSQEMAGKSKGAFDVTVGPLVRLWRRARRTAELPDQQRLTEALDSTGYTRLHLDPKGRSVMLDKSGMFLDLGGIAKGYAADEAMAVLNEHGLTRAMVVAGGDIAVGRPPPGKEGWIIAIAQLESVDETASSCLVLHDSAVSTSGDANQNVEIGGVRYSHIVDPRTGLALKGRSSVTVVARDCTTSDALATAASVLGPHEGLRLVDSTNGAAAIFVQAEGEGVRSFETSRWRQIRKSDAKQASIQ